MDGHVARCQMNDSNTKDDTEVSAAVAIDRWEKEVKTSSAKMSSAAVGLARTQLQ